MSANLTMIGTKYGCKRWAFFLLPFFVSTTSFKFYYHLLSLIVELKIYSTATLVAFLLPVVVERNKSSTAISIFSVPNILWGLDKNY